MGRAEQHDALSEALLEDRGESHRPIQMVRLRQVPCHELDVAERAAECRNALDAGKRPRHRGALEGRVIDGCAGHFRAERGVGMKADEEIRLVVVRHGGPIFEGQIAIVVSRQKHAHAQPRLDGRLDAPGDSQSEVLLFRA